MSIYTNPPLVERYDALVNLIKDTIIEIDGATLPELVRACDTMRDYANDFSLSASERLLWREMLAVVSHHKDR